MELRIWPPRREVIIPGIFPVTFGKMISFPKTIKRFPHKPHVRGECCIPRVPFHFLWLVLTFANSGRGLPCTLGLFSFNNLLHTLNTHFLLHLTLPCVFLLSQLLNRSAEWLSQCPAHRSLLTFSCDDAPHNCDSS